MADTATLRDREKLKLGSLTVGAKGHGSSGWWGMMMLIITEASLFAYLLFSYYYTDAQFGHEWLPKDLPSYRLAGPNTLILIASSVAAWFGERGIKHGSRMQLIAGLLVAIVLGAAFAAIQYYEWQSKPFTLATNSYASLYFVTTGFHMAHVIGGLLILAALLLWSALGYFAERRHVAVSIGIVYWHFVDAVWLAVFFTYYVTPHLW